MPHHMFMGFRIPDPYEVNPLQVVNRDEWGALPERGVEITKKRIKTVVWAFNTGVDTCVSRDECAGAVRQLQQQHLQMGYPDIYYNFLIGGDGNVYEGRGWHGKHSAYYPIKYGRTLIVAILGKGKDEYGKWYPPFDEMTKKLMNCGLWNNLIRKEVYKTKKEWRKKFYFEKFKKEILMQTDRLEILQFDDPLRLTLRPQPVVEPEEDFSNDLHLPI